MSLVPLALVPLGVVACAYGAFCAAAYPAGGFWLVWVVVGAACLALAWALWTGAWSRVPRWLRACLGVLAAGLLAGVVACCVLIARAAQDEPPADLDYVIVLGASLNADGSPKQALRNRLDAALAYLDANPGTLCVVSGGQGDDEPCTEASAMREYLVARGVDEGRVLCEDRSTTTEENLRLSRELLDARGEGGDVSVGVVTNDFHVLRATLLARAQGFPDACGISAPIEPVYLPQAVLRECVALAKAALVGELG